MGLTQRIRCYCSPQRCWCCFEQHEVGFDLPLKKKTPLMNTVNDELKFILDYMVMERLLDETIPEGHPYTIFEASDGHFGHRGVLPPCTTYIDTDVISVIPPRLECHIQRLRARLGFSVLSVAVLQPCFALALRSDKESGQSKCKQPLSDAES